MKKNGIIKNKLFCAFTISLIGIFLSAGVIGIGAGRAVNHSHNRDIRQAWVEDGILASAEYSAAYGKEIKKLANQMENGQLTPQQYEEQSKHLKETVYNKVYTKDLEAKVVAESEKLRKLDKEIAEHNSTVDTVMGFAGMGLMAISLIATQKFEKKILEINNKTNKKDDAEEGVIYEK